MEILRKNQKEMLRIKNMITEMKNAFGVVNKLDTLRKEPLSLRISQYKPAKLKS